MSEREFEAELKTYSDEHLWTIVRARGASLHWRITAEDELKRRGITTRDAEGHYLRSTP